MDNISIESNDDNSDTNLNKKTKNNDNIISDENLKEESRKQKKINPEVSHLTEGTKNDMGQNKEESLCCEKSNFNIDEGKEEYLQNGVNDKELSLINNKENIYEEKTKLSEKEMNIENNSSDSEINIDYQTNYCKDSDNDNGFIFIKIVECISKIIHELLFLYSIDITKIYAHFKIFKYDRVFTSAKTIVHIFNKMEKRISSNNNIECQNIDNKNEESIKSGYSDGVHTNGKNFYPSQEIEIIKNKNNHYRKRRNKDNEQHPMFFYNFLNYPLILPNNSVNPREDFYLYKFSTEKKTSKAMFDDLCYNNIDEIMLLASSFDNILSLINSFYVILLNILAKSFNQYCFAAIDLNDEHSLHEERKLSSNYKNGILQYSMNLLGTQKNESTYKSIESHTTPKCIQSDNTLNFENEIDRRIQRYNNNSDNNTANYTIDHKNHHTSRNNNQVENVEYNSISIYPKMLTVHEMVSYFISSLSLAFSYTNTIDSCFFSGFQKLIFMSTHLNVNICTNACMQTLTKCSSIFTLENSPFFLNILQNFEKKGSKHENNYNSKKSKTVSNSSRALSNNPYHDNNKTDTKSNYITDENHNHINFIAYSANSISDNEVYININDGKTCSHRIGHLYGNMNFIEEFEIVEESNEINDKEIVENGKKKTTKRRKFLIRL
ncbi:conserved Plasmodium protein, unknown function [Plasmodium vinckei]|uniref:Uncharacterized protein n=1 Tax=Plasmodium vinckei TaxID=5860 RepID=A0A6V7TBV9_PLAVN|nr:conserved Plasmodium protein, unknown function [Plasmodium vinckei]